ncbi:CHAT domain-containing protein [Streptomyces sp. NPDC046915]|uniref:CHAT domain-containing protein n=1 Tax=Streptomyces sp. NPDC046915 TaxID=3155257 RepID=UPI0033E74F5C
MLNELYQRALLLTQETDPSPAIEAWESVMAHPGHDTLPAFARWNSLIALGTARLQRYETDARIDDLVGALTCLESAVRLSGAVPPDRQAMCQYNLAQAQERRYRRSQDAQDLLTAVRTMWGLVDAPPPGATALGICLWVSALIERHTDDKPVALRQLRVTALERLLVESDATDTAWRQLGLAAALVDLLPTNPAGSRDMAARALALAEESCRVLPDGPERQTAIGMAADIRDMWAWIDENIPAPADPGPPQRLDLFEWVQGLADLPDREERVARLREAIRQNPHEAARDTWVMLCVALADEILKAETNEKIETDEAITVLRAVLGEPDSPASRIRLELTFNLGMAYSRRRAGDPLDNEREAMSLFEQCLSEVEPGHHLYPYLACAIARMVRDDRRGSRSAQVDRAIALCLDALAALPPDVDPGRRARVTGSLALLLPHRTNGDPEADIEEAIGLGRQALELMDPVRDAMERGNMHHNLAHLYRGRLAGGREANLWRAIEHYRACLAAQPKETMPVDWAMTQTSLGVAYSMMRGRDVEVTQRLAVDAFMAALSVFTLRDHPVDWAHAEFGLGVALGDFEVRAEPDPEQAIAHLTSCLQVFTEADTPWEWALTQSWLGISRMQSGPAEQRTAAAGHFRAALRVLSFENSPRDWAMARLNLAQLVPADDQMPLQDTIRVLTEHGRRNEAFTAWILQVRLLSERQDWTGAAEAGARAADLHESLYQEALLRESRHMEQRAVSGDLMEIVTAMLRAGRTLEAVLLLERTRARELGEALGQEREGLDRVRQADPDAFAAFRAAADRLAALSSAERSVPVAGLGAQEVERLNLALVRAIARARTERDAALARLSGVTGFLEPPGVGELSAAVGPHRPLVYVYVFGGAAHVLLVRRDGEGGLDVESRSTDDVRELATAEAPTALLDRLADTLASWLRELRTEEVTLVACGPVGRWPLHALVSDGRCLVDDFRISFTPSAAVLARRHAPRPGPPVLAAVGNPTADLRYASVEAAAAAALGSWSRATVRHGTDVTPEAFQEDLRGATHVHLACHGVFDAARPTESAFVLAEGSRLTLRRIMAERAFRGVRLVFASACGTASTDTFVADEAIGLASGLLQAGASEVIASLWNVDDLATMLLATRFHAELGHGTGRALQSAQLWLRDSTAAEFARWCRHLSDAVDDPSHRARLAGAAALFEDRPPGTRCYAEPRYWAAFIHLGAAVSAVPGASPDRSTR